MKAIEDSEKIAEKLWKNLRPNQTTDQVRLAMLIAINHEPNMLQQLAKREILDHCINLDKLCLPERMIEYLKQ